MPLGTFVAVTGVSGSGKSTLVTEVLYRALARELNGSREPVGAHDRLLGAEHIDKIIEIDQSPIGRTPRSNPATYTGLFGPIRELFAGVPEARVRGYQPGRFWFNVKGGRCEHCKGDGILKIEMQFLPDVYVPCEVCKGKRYNREALEIHYKGKSIADVLEMTIAEALDFFSAVPNVRAKLQTLNDVGLGYVHLGQPATTLSGGEAQRVKLATELSRRATGRTLYVLDEPTTGLHFADVEKLLEVLHRLVDGGNTVLVIEHNLDVIKTADWIVDLGPAGGDRGGRIIAEGTPEKVAATDGSATGEYLARVLRGEPLVPLSDVSFAEEAGRAAGPNGRNGRNGHDRADPVPSRPRPPASARRPRRRPGRAWDAQLPLGSPRGRSGPVSARREGGRERAHLDVRELAPAASNAAIAGISGPPRRTIGTMPDIDFAFLADAAETVPGQKFHVLGGGVARIGGRRFPLRHPHLALVIGLQVTAPETEREHDIRFVLLDPDGGEVAGATGSLVARSQRDGRDAVLTFSIDLWNLTFPAPGDYSFRILVNGSERKRLPLLLLAPPEDGGNGGADGGSARRMSDPATTRARPTGPARHERRAIDDLALAPPGPPTGCWTRPGSAAPTRWVTFLEPSRTDSATTSRRHSAPAAVRARAAYGPRTRSATSCAAELTEPFLGRVGPPHPEHGPATAREPQLGRAEGLEQEGRGRRRVIAEGQRPPRAGPGDVAESSLLLHRPVRVVGLRRRPARSGTGPRPCRRPRRGRTRRPWSSAPSPGSAERRRDAGPPRRVRRRSMAATSAWQVRPGRRPCEEGGRQDRVAVDAARPPDAPTRTSRGHDAGVTSTAPSTSSRPGSSTRSWTDAARNGSSRSSATMTAGRSSRLVRARIASVPSSSGARPRRGAGPSAPVRRPHPGRGRPGRASRRGCG